MEENARSETAFASGLTLFVVLIPVLTYRLCYSLPIYAWLPATIAASWISYKIEVGVQGNRFIRSGWGVACFGVFVFVAIATLRVYMANAYQGLYLFGLLVCLVMSFHHFASRC